MPQSKLTEVQYRQLAEFRFQLRKFLHFSEDAARQAGVEPQQHSLLLQLKGLPEGVRPTITTVADRLFLRHHSAGELVDRAVEHGLVERFRGEDDRREVFLRLTPRGNRIIEDLARQHRAQILSDGLMLLEAITALVERIE